VIFSFCLRCANGVLSRLRWVWHTIRFNKFKRIQLKRRKAKAENKKNDVSFTMLALSSSIVATLKASGFTMTTSSCDAIDVSQWRFENISCDVLRVKHENVKATRSLLSEYKHHGAVVFMTVDADVKNQWLCYEAMMRVLPKRLQPHVIVTVWRDLQAVNEGLPQYTILDASHISDQLTQTLLHLSSQVNDTWRLLHQYYWLLEFKARLAKCSDPLPWALLQHQAGLAEYGKLLAQQVATQNHNPFWSRERLVKYSVPAVSFVSLIFSWQCYADYHSYHRVSQQLQRSLRSLRYSVPPPIVAVHWYTKGPSAKRVRILIVKPYEHVINSIFKTLLPIANEQQAIAYCFNYLNHVLGQRSLSTIISGSISSWLSPSVIPRVYLKLYRKPKVLPCVQSLLRLQATPAPATASLLHQVNQYADQLLLQWFMRLHALSISPQTLSTLWNPLTAPQGAVAQLVQFLISQQTATQRLGAFKMTSVSRWFLRKRNNIEQIAYWQGLAALGARLHTLTMQQTKMTNTQFVLHTLHDANASLRQMAQIVRQWAAAVKDPELQTAMLHVLELPLQGLWHGILQTSQQELTALWQQTVWQPWHDSLSTYFPFAYTSEDASLKAMYTMFDPKQGQLVQFAQHYLDPLFQTKSQPLQFLNAALPWDATALKAIRQAQQWSQYLFQDNGQCQLRWEFYPLLQARIAMWLLVSDKQRMIYHNGPRRWHAMTVPHSHAEQDTTLTVMTSQNQTYSKTTHGVWGLWRLIQQAAITPRGNQRYLLTWSFHGKAGPYTQLLFNPHTTFNLWQTPPFTLPETLFKKNQPML